MQTLWYIVASAVVSSFIGCAADALLAEENVQIIDEQLRAEHKLHPFYQKILLRGGLLYTSSEKVADQALTEAARLVDGMLAETQAAKQALVDANVRIVVMAATEMTTDIPEHSHLQPKDYWDRRARGLGWSPEAPIVSCGEENLLGFAGDPYEAENILIHEFAHAVHSTALSRLDPTFDARLRAAHEAAAQQGLWKGTYAGSNPLEYWAEGSQSWFDANAPQGAVHNDVDTREEIKRYDPALAELLKEAYGDAIWRYNRPARKESVLNGARQQRFEWPRRLLDGGRLAD